MKRSFLMVLLFSVVEKNVFPWTPLDILPKGGGEEGIISKYNRCPNLQGSWEGICQTENSSTPYEVQIKQIGCNNLIIGDHSYTLGGSDTSGVSLQGLSNIGAFYFSWKKEETGADFLSYFSSRLGPQKFALVEGKGAIYIQNDELHLDNSLSIKNIKDGNETLSKVSSQCILKKK